MLQVLMQFVKHGSSVLFMEVDFFFIAESFLILM